jgi:hypothetical protein
MSYQPFEIDMDLTNVQEFAGDGGAPPALPPGEYVFDVVNVEQGTSKASQPKIEVTFECVEGPFTGTRVNNNYSLQPQAIGRWKKLQMACGGPLNKISSEAVMGARIRAAIVHNEGQPQKNPDGTVKTGADGSPIPPRVFANVVNERPLDQPVQQEAAPPPVTRGKPTNATGAARRA